MSFGLISSASLSSTAAAADLVEDQDSGVAVLDGDIVFGYRLIPSRSGVTSATSAT